ncbi:hypothetical protein BSKO_03282 [Bryopsis sp. KO-2023]|nr:hypothetical protein BSKO_03282 [Bryopsis sp. KO-2023]
MSLKAQCIRGKQPAGLPEGTLARRPDKGGTVGRQVSLTTNHFGVRLSKTNVFHYDVEVKPAGEDRYGADDDPTSGSQSLPRKLCQAIIDKCSKENNWPVKGWSFDGKKNIYSPEEIFPRTRHVFAVSMTGPRGDRAFEVITQHANTVNLQDLLAYIERADVPLPQECQQCLEVSLKYSAAIRPNCQIYGRSIFFSDPRGNQRLPGGSELWLGYHQSIRPCQLGLTLNIDTTAGAFLEERSLVEVMKEAAGVRSIDDLKRMTDQQWKRMRKAVSGLLVQTTHRPQGKNQKRKSTGLTKKAATGATFGDREGNQQTVAEYWKKAYGPLKYPFLPCLDVSKGKRVNYLPPEACTVAPGQRQLKLTDGQTREMVTRLAKPPADRKADIMQALNSSKLAEDPMLKHFGMTVDKKMTSVTSRLLPQPHLEYKTPGSLDTGTRGAWNLENIKLFKGGEITGWAIVNFANQNQVMVDGEQGLLSFIQGLISMLKELGIKLPEGMPPLCHGDPRRNPMGPMSEAKDKAIAQFKKVNLMMVLLPTKDSALYNSVKACGNVQLGVTTQCFVTRSAGIGSPPRGRLQYLANIGIKINHKVGGVNTKVAGPVADAFPVVGKKPFIVFGADVTHPGGFDESEPSVAAVVASMDPYLGQYQARIITQPHRQELIDLRVPAKDLLKAFFMKTRQKPQAILFYRDGVSEGELQKVLEHEYQELRAACESLEAGYTPPITFVVVQKRHHTRLFPTTERDGDRNGNVLPGTVVDQGIVGPRDFEFFLNSHAGIKGTNKSGHYRVLVDENGFGSDGLQLMTYWTSFLYCRCTRSVSYAPPAYYAHLAALQGKILVHESTSDVDQAEAAERASIKPAVQDTMFFI